MRAKAIRSNKVMASPPSSSPVTGRYVWKGAGAGAPNSPPENSGAVSLGTLPVGETLSITESLLLSQTTDDESDPLTVIGTPVVSGEASLTGAGFPYTLTVTGMGGFSLDYSVSDGTNTIAQSASGVGVAAYSRKDDYLGLYRARAGSFTSYWTIPLVDYVQTTDTAVFEFAALVYSDEPGTEGTVEPNVLTRGSSSFRNRITRNTDGSITINSSNNITLTIAPAGTWPLNEFVRFRITNHPTNGIVLDKMDVDGVYQNVTTTARGTFDKFQPLYLMGNAIKYHGSLLYFSCVVNGSTVYDFQMDEMQGATIYSSHDVAVTGTYTNSAGPIIWKDETPESVAPQPDIQVAGTLTHGSTLTLSSATLTFTGGMPQAQLYDDMVGKSGQVGTAATIGTFFEVKNPDVNQTYKVSGPGGRPYVVRYDGDTGERISRIWSPGFPFGEAFVSKLLRIPTGRAWPGSTSNKLPWTPVTGVIPNDSTWKDSWLLSADDGGGTGSDLATFTHISNDILKHAGNSSHLGGGSAAPGAINANGRFVWGEWQLFDDYARHNNSTPLQGLHVQSMCSSTAKNVQVVSNGSVLSAARGYAPFNLIADGAWLDTNPLCRIEAAEIYMAVGTNAPCRAVIGNSVKWTNCTKKATCPPLSWASDNVQVRCGLGTLVPASETLYIYVIGPDGVPLWEYGKKLN